jgi:hypothetical protein
LIDSGLCRNEVNKRTGRIVRLIKWAVGEGMIPAPVHHGLQAVSGLRRGRADVRETEPVRPVPEAFVDAIRPHVSRQVWTMVQLQRLSRGGGADGYRLAPDRRLILSHDPPGLYGHGRYEPDLAEHFTVGHGGALSTPRYRFVIVPDPGVFDDSPVNQFANRGRPVPFGKRSDSLFPCVR